MSCLSAEHKAKFRRDGFLVVESAVSAAQLQAMRDEFAAWAEESRRKKMPWGSTFDRRARFDVVPGHCCAGPVLRRVNSPVEVSSAYNDAMLNSAVPDMVCELIGPNIKYHHSRISSNLPGTPGRPRWRQDFAYTPHTNDDVITTLLFVDDVTDDNGPLEVVPGTHTGEIHTLWRDSQFTAATSGNVADLSECRAVRCTGPAGSCLFMHTRLLHGTASNRSQAPRTLFITVYSAEDAIPLSPNPIPSRLEGQIVRGRATGSVRCIPYQLQLPQRSWADACSGQQAG